MIKSELILWVEQWDPKRIERSEGRSRRLHRREKQRWASNYLSLTISIYTHLTFLFIHILMHAPNRDVRGSGQVV